MSRMCFFDNADRYTYLHTQVYFKTILCHSLALPFRLAFKRFPILRWFGKCDGERSYMTYYKFFRRFMVWTWGHLFNDLFSILKYACLVCSARCIFNECSFVCVFFLSPPFLPILLIFRVFCVSEYSPHDFFLKHICLRFSW